MSEVVATRLLVVLIGLVVDDVEEAEFVDALRGGDDAEPVAELLLLEKLLGAVVGLACRLYNCACACTRRLQCVD